MPDARTPAERFMWEKVGPPLYYCAECLRAVKVVALPDQEPKITRTCECTGQIIAPRKAVCVGEGGMDMPTRAKVAWNALKANLTGRCA